MTDNGPPASIDQFIPGLCRTSATVSGCRRPTPDTWNLERPACFEIVPTAARSGAADKSALPMTTPPATPCLRMASAIDALTREYREIVLYPGFSSKAEPGAISSSRCQTTRTRPSEPSRVRKSLLLDERTTERGRTDDSLSSGRPPVWWSQTGSNRRPPACKAGALPTELWPRQRSRDQTARDQIARAHPGARPPLRAFAF